MWILGGFLQPEYSHVRNDVSSLVAVNAPNKKLFDKFIITSSTLWFIFYIGLHWGSNNGVGSISGPILFVISGLLGVLVAVFFPLDEGGELITTRGKMHLILISISGILTTAGMVALWFRLESVAGWSTFATFSLITAIVSVILMVFTRRATNSNYMGLVERFMISSYQIYYFVLALMVFLTN
jgi:drug/metabolite transporter (DMT)-like permease